MDSPEDIRAAQERLSELVAAYNPAEHEKAHLLEPFREQIASLRSQGATYKRVKHILEQADVTVCIATVARFCQSRGLNPAKKKAAKKSAKTTRKKTGNFPPGTTPKTTPSSHKEEPSDEPAKTPPKRKRGPRIANPNDI